MGRHDAMCWYHKQTNSIWFYGGVNTAASDVARYTLYRANITTNGTAVTGWQLMQGAETEDLVYPNATFPGGSAYGLATWTNPAGEFFMWGEIDPDLANQQVVHPTIWKLDPTTLIWTRFFASRRQTDDPMAGPIGVFDPSYSPRMRQGAAVAVTRDGLVWIYGGFYVYAGTDELMHAGDIWAFNISSMQWAYMGGPLLNFSGQAYSDGGTSKMFSALGRFHPNNIPAVRTMARMAEDESGNLWIMGGGNGYYSVELSPDLCVFTASTSRQWACVSHPLYNTPNARRSDPGDATIPLWPSAIKPGQWIRGLFDGVPGFFLLQGNGHAGRGDDIPAPQPMSLADGWFVQTAIVDQQASAPLPWDQGFHVDVRRDSDLNTNIWSQDMRRSALAIDWGAGSPFSPTVQVDFLRYLYTGFIVSPFPIDLSFLWVVRSDDGALFTLYDAAGDPQSVGDTSNHGPEERYGTITLRAGANRFSVDHYDSFSFCSLSISFHPAGDYRRRVVPAEWLSMTGIGPTPTYSPERNPMSSGMMLDQFWNTSACGAAPDRTRYWNSTGFDFLWTKFKNPMWEAIYSRPKSCFRYTMWVNVTDSNSTSVGFDLTVRNGAVKIFLNNLQVSNFPRGDVVGNSVVPATSYIPNAPNKLVVEISSSGDVDFQGREEEFHILYTLDGTSYPLDASVARTYNWAPTPPAAPPVAIPAAEPVSAGPAPSAGKTPISSTPISLSAPQGGNISDGGSQTLGVGPIVGIIFAILVVIAAVLIVAFVLRRRRRDRDQNGSSAASASASAQNAELLEPSHYASVQLTGGSIQNSDELGKKKKKKRKTDMDVESDWESSSSDGEISPEVAQEEVAIKKGLKKEWVIPWKELDILGRLGHGSFGVVMKAEYGGAEVAMKQCALTLDRSQLEQFKAESILVLSLKVRMMVCFSY
jgi:hypothetical protein